MPIGARTTPLATMVLHCGLQDNEVLSTLGMKIRPTLQGSQPCGQLPFALAVRLGLRKRFLNLPPGLLSYSRGVCSRLLVSSDSRPRRH
jgi:hypothetical protein